MVAQETYLKGCYIISPKISEDSRGYFFESFNQSKFNDLIGGSIKFIQDNQSFSSKGVLRGLHYQVGDHQQAKLVRVISGSVLDVALDIRKSSPTFGKHVSAKLTEENMHQLFIPRGFAHGFVVLSDSATFSYKVDNQYAANYDKGIFYADKDLDIDWHFEEKDLKLSKKDLNQALFSDFNDNLD